MKTIFTLAILLCSFLFLFSQNQKNIQEEFKKNGEIYFKFELNIPKDINEISKIISIDNRQDNIVFAYANEWEFDKFLNWNLTYEVLSHPNEGFEPVMKSWEEIQYSKAWDYYPTYEAYVAMMYQFEANYPSICDVYSIGQSVNGRELLVARISDNVNVDEDEPEFFYTSTMHGDETAGWIFMLRMIDSLLTSYGTAPRITNLVNSIDIYINPLANPDGTYYGGNHTVANARRYNANNYDLNRNFPDVVLGMNPNTQPETYHFVEFAESTHLTMSSNLHAGVEVCNYPWDHKYTLCADDDWWQFVCHEYADMAQLHSPSGYMNGWDDGITNGADWYVVDYGRQDYMCFFDQCREFTLELSDTKLLPANQLEAYWGYNYRSLFNYLEQVLYGIRGIVTDANTGQPLEAEVYIINHDIDGDSSWVYSDLPIGNYHRPIIAGTYDVRYSAPCYETQIIQNVAVQNHNTTIVNVQLQPSADVVDFSANTTNISVGNSVNFTDQSCGTPLSWLWTITGPGVPVYINGTNNTTQNPQVRFDDVGLYDVTLTITTNSGSFSETKNDYITVGAADYNMQTGTVTTCSGNFYDSGGPSGSYSDNEDLIMTFYPSTANAFLEFTFTMFDVEYQSSCNYDWLKIYDGVNTSAPLLGTYCGTNSPGVAKATNASGALTFAFHSDYSVTKPGWAAIINCIVTSTPPIANFVADDTTPSVSQVVNFTDLSQNDPTSWQWTFNPSTISYTGGTNQYSQNPQVYFNNSGYYTVSMIATNGDGNDTETKTNYILAGTAGIWTGNTSTNWNTASNWEVLSIPVSGDNVIIPASAPNWPVKTDNLTLGTDCNSITMNGNSYLTVTGNLIVPLGYQVNCDNGGSPHINLEGDFDLLGTFNYGTTQLTFNGVNISQVTGNGAAIHFYDVVINKDNQEVSFHNPVTINNNLQINEGAWLTNIIGNTLNILGDFTMNNSTTEKSSFVDLGSTNVVGNINVYKPYIDYRWHFLSPPVDESYSMIFLDMFLYYYVENGDYFQTILPTDVLLETAKGYMTWSTIGDPVVNYTGGQFNTGNISPLLSVTDEDISGTIDGDEGWNLIGNPYPSTIDFLSNDLTWTGVSPTIYLYNSTGGYYSTYNRVTMVGSNGGTQYIPSMQGFFVKVYQESPVPLITLHENSRVHNTQLNYKNDELKDEIRIEIQADDKMDELVFIGFEGSGIGYDDQFDAIQLEGFDDAPMIYTQSEGIKLTVNAIEKFESGIHLPIHLDISEEGIYQLNISKLNLKENLNCYLEDIKSGDLQLIDEGSNISFNYNNNDDPHRYNLHFIAPGLDENINKNKIQVFSNGHTLYFNKESEEPANVFIYNMLGQYVDSFIFAGQTHSLEIPQDGVYLVKVSSDDTIKCHNVIIN